MRRVTVSAILAVLLASPAAHAWDGSQSLEGNLDPAQVLLFEDFEQAGFGDAWPIFWDTAPGPETVGDPVFQGTHALVLHGVAGEHYSQGVGEYAPAGDGMDEAYMRLYLRLPDSWDLGSCNQLKLFAIKGGATTEDTYGGAGEPPTGYDKMSVVLSIDNARGLHFYTYHMDQSDIWGDYFYLDLGGSTATLENGRWICLELGVQLNTPGQADGVVRGWVDGQLRGETTGLRFREVAEVKIRRFDIETYFGGDGPENTSPVDQDIFVDNVVVSRQPIGMFGGSGDGDADADADADADTDADADADADADSDADVDGDADGDGGRRGMSGCTCRAYGGASKVGAGSLALLALALGAVLARRRSGRS